MESDVRKVIVACCVAAFVTPLMSTMMNLSLVGIGDEFGQGSHNLAYVNTAFLLSSVIFMVPAAKISDILGKKRMFITGLAIVLASCILGFFAPGFWFLIVCRALTGLGSSFIVSTSVSMNTDIVNPSQ
ncbi:MAG: MFS transporter, partial [Candidatus Methanomethylophilaceae archaeon]|nr:MFS transporter [Candidatus Methanomethylophilaceae archaeon]